MSAVFTVRITPGLRGVRLAGTPPPVKSVPEEDSRRREQEAYERGRREAEQAMSVQLLAQRAEIRELQQGVLEALRQTVPQVVHDTEQALIGIALEAAGKLVAGLPISPELVEAVVQEALAQVEESSEYHIYLHPEDLEVLQRAGSSLVAEGHRAPRMHFHRAPELTRGGCQVKTHFGVIDARRETKLELLQKSLLA